MPMTAALPGPVTVMSMNLPSRRPFTRRLSGSGHLTVAAPARQPVAPAGVQILQEAIPK